ncbi:GNAT family N-acetyltransferase [Bremerella cremea]|uniref:GNAT family N-acetyltransferase n=1 Tax=Bremerella cremea TaxID=1031537 RepID=UPI0031EE56B2
MKYFEPDEYAAIALAIEQNDTEFCQHWANCPEVSLTQEDRWYRLISDIDHPYFNSIFVANLAEDRLAEEIEAAIGPFRERNLPVTWWVGPTTRPTNLGEALVQHGLTHTTRESLMAARSYGVNFELLSLDVEILLVRSAPQLRTWVEIMTGLFSDNSFPQEPWRKILLKAGLHEDAKLQHVLALVDGEPAGVGSVYFGSSAGGIYNISVLPAYRRRGVATSLTLTLASLIEEQGYDLVTLCASAQAVSLYKRLGFGKFGEVNCFAQMPD